MSMLDIKVVKRDGAIEPFLPWKIQRVVMAAGLTAEQSYTLVGNILDWMKSQNTDTVNSVQIRDKVLEELRGIDSYAANMFDWYQKTKN